MIFVDTSFWYAFFGRRDERHAESRRLMSGTGTRRLVTTNAVLGETWTLVRRRHGHGATVQFLAELDDSPRLSRWFVSETQEADAWEWLRRHDERRYSYVDATSFAVMRDLGIDSALAFDGDFAAAGFVELRIS